MSDFRLVAGLGNPGKKYADTRHNVGFMVADELARSYNLSFQNSRFDAEIAKGDIGGRKVIIAKPLSFMNLSGHPIHGIADYFRITSEDMLVVYDDIDLAFGRIQLRQKGGHGGHKGIKSIMETFGGDSFVRLRVGVGRPAMRQTAADYVLGEFSKDEKSVLYQIIERAKDAVVTVLCKSAQIGMNEFNNKLFPMGKTTDGGD